MKDQPNVPAIAEAIRKGFPELENRAFAIMEADLTKENQPNLPLCFVALLGTTQVGGSNNLDTPMDLLENIIIEFWQKPVLYKREDGSESPFYSYQDYEDVMNRLFTVLSDFSGPKRKRVRFLSMATSADEFALTVCFKVSVQWRWCNDTPVEGAPVKMLFDFSPDVPKLPYGSPECPPSSC